MAKRARKKPALRKAKSPARKKTGKKKPAKKVAAAKKGGKTVAAEKLVAQKPVARKTQKKPVATTKSAGKPPSAPPESLPHKIADAVTAVVDILTDAERLHRKLDPGVSNEPE
jgi:hypothetical protein